MMGELALLKTAEALMTHAAKRQGMIARNVANADTPNFRAMDMPDFATTLSDTGFRLRATRPGHMQATGPAAQGAIERPDEAAPNGNTVTIENEMMQAAHVRKSHDMGLSIFTAAHGVLAAAIGRGR